jgi:GNAT superfamily N-acetyltransferase
VIVVRSGTEADHEPSVQVWKVADTARRGGSSAPPEHEERVRSRFAVPHTWLLVADDDGELVGITSGMPARADDGAGVVIDGLCHLSLVFVLPAWWGRGVGGQLVDAALVEAPSRAYRRIQLWTHESNERAQRLYAGRGFTREGRTKDDDLGEQIGLWVRDV